MSGMAGNVTAFNTVFTYDLYQSYVRPGASDAHYLTVGRFATVGGIAVSIGAAYFAARYNNMLDVLQLVFSFVNAPLFATFMLGMFWRRTTGHGAFTGLFSGTAAAALVHGATLAEGKGGWITNAHTFPSVMAQNFYIAIAAWTTCFVVTALVSLATRPKSDEEMRGLVMGLTEIPTDAHEPWFRRPGPSGGDRRRGARRHQRRVLVTAVIDLRLIIGVFFVIVGLLLLTVTGARAPLTPGPVNLYMGAVAIAFGAVMCALSLRSRRSK